MDLDPATYPFDVQRHGFVIEDLALSSERTAIIDVRRELERVGPEAGALRSGLQRFGALLALLTCGSSASVARLLDKLRECPVGSAHALRLSLLSWVPVYAASAHLNHDPGDNRPRNLAALCQTLPYAS